MVVRDRKEAGKKAAETNLKKDPKYYKNTGSAGGRAVNAVKRAFATIPGLARRAAQQKYLKADQGIKYVVTSESLKRRTFLTRDEARKYKNALKNYGYKSHIIKVVYDESGSGFILERKEVW